MVSVFSWKFLVKKKTQARFYTHLHSCKLRLTPLKWIQMCVALILQFPLIDTLFPLIDFWSVSIKDNIEN